MNLMGNSEIVNDNGLSTLPRCGSSPARGGSIQRKDGAPSTKIEQPMDTSAQHTMVNFSEGSRSLGGGISIYKPMRCTDYKFQDVRGWLMSEKLNGVRAIWTGEKLMTRQWKVIRAPGFFTNALPRNTWLDGELWAGLGRFEFVKATVQRKHIDVLGWILITYNVFDLPQSAEPYKVRYQELFEAVEENATVKIVRHIECGGKKQLDGYLNSIIKKGGEGVVLRNPESLYTSGYSRNYVRYKNIMTR